MTPVPATSGRRVVVGYGGSPGSRAALERAVDDGVVFVVHAYPRPRSWLGAPNYQERLDAVLAEAETTIRDLCDETGGPLDRDLWMQLSVRCDDERLDRPDPLLHAPADGVRRGEESWLGANGM
jgi:hypothetical protein